MRRRSSILLAFVLALGAAPATFAQTAVWPPITDAPAAVRTPGRFVWADLVTNDVGTAAAFYGKVFGWTFETYGPKDDRKTYTQVSADGVPIGGRAPGSFGPVTAQLQAAYWALHDDPRYMEPVRGLDVAPAPR